MSDTTPVTEPAPDDDRHAIEADAFSRMCKALAHPVRIQILQHLKYVNPCICGEIVDRFPLAQSTISQHLRMLKDAGLIQGTIEGSRTCYCVDHDRLDAFKKMAKAL
ncbi:MAG: ArsR/SmtB family transcription factor [Desulfatirhabdiaceae bacterium]